MSDVFLCGGDCVEDVNRSERHLRESPVLFGDRYTYRCIITNDWDSEEKCVIETYNKRGARECDFDRHIVNECYDLERIMGNLANFFDYEAFGRELFMYDYTMGANGNVFRNI